MEHRDAKHWRHPRSRPPLRHAHDRAADEFQILVLHRHVASSFKPLHPENGCSRVDMPSVQSASVAPAPAVGDGPDMHRKLPRRFCHDFTGVSAVLRSVGRQCGEDQLLAPTALRQGSVLYIVLVTHFLIHRVSCLY